MPCVIADELTEEQMKAFRLVDNKVGEIATWDADLLELELIDISQDLAVFGFDAPAGESDDSGDDDPGTPPGFNYQEQYGVIVMCENEARQKETYEKLSSMGYECKVVAT